MNLYAPFIAVFSDERDPAIYTLQLRTGKHTLMNALILGFTPRPIDV